MGLRFFCQKQGDPYSVQLHDAIQITSVQYHGVDAYHLYGVLRTKHDITQLLLKFCRLDTHRQA